MIKKLLLTSFLFFSFIVVIYPSKKENTKLFDYCYSLEIILSRILIQKRESISKKFNSISKDIAKFGVKNTKGALLNKTIYQYKTSKNSLIIDIVPNEIYCFAGYWIEKVKPGTIESVLYEKSKNTINEFKVLKDEVDELLNDMNSEYEFIIEEFNRFL